MRKVFNQSFNEMSPGVKAIVVVCILLVVAGTVSAAALVASHDAYTRGEAAADANVFCAEHRGVEHFGWRPEDEGWGEVICKDGSLTVLP